MSTIVIRVGGTNITSNVIFGDAEFSAQVNGQPGNAKFRVRDKAHIYQFITGETLTLDVDGVRVWGGWTTLAQPAYAFKVDDTSNTDTTSRIWILTGSDYNLLFVKRFLINKAHPNQQLPNYAAGTPDDVVIKDVVANFLDLTGDGITTNGVTRVGSPNPDKVGNIGNPGDSWGAAMALIARPIGTIFYIDPLRDLGYVDDSSIDAPYSLSDTPTGGEIGYRDMEVLFDGSKLVNDAMVWGAGTGSVNGLVTFARIQDAASIAAHGRWQSGEFTTLLFRQASVNERASTTVYGSPQHKRGGKDDAISINCTVFQPGFVVGQKVSFESDVFSYTNTLPIRRMTIRFPTPTEAQFNLTLSNDIDMPWGNYEFWFPPINVTIPDIDIPPIQPLPPPPGGCDCGITDTFTRIVIGDWGISDSTTPWILNSLTNGPGGLTPGLSWSVTGTNGYVACTNSSVADGSVDMLVPTPTLDATITISDYTQTGIGTSYGFAYINFTSPGVNSDYWFHLGFGPYVGGQPGSSAFYTHWPTATYSNTGNIFTGAPMHIRCQLDGSGMRIKAWPVGDSEPGAWGLDVPSDTSGAIPLTFAIEADLLPTGGSMTFDDLSIVGVDRCTENRFDNFDRTVSDGFGVSTTGYTYDSSPNSTSMGTDGSAGYVIITGGDQAFAEIDTNGPWRTSTGFIMTTRLQVDALPPIGQTATFEMGVFSNDFSFLDGFDFSLTADNPVPPSDSYIGLWHNGGQPDPFSDPPSELFFTGSTGWWNIKWEFRPPLSRVRYWHDGSPEPSTWVIETSVSVFTGNETFWSSFAHTGAGTTTMLVDFIDFEYAGKPCFQGGTPPTTGGAVSGYVWEDATRIDSLYYQLLSTILPGSAQVFLDGFIQRPVIDYIELPDVGQILFTSPITDPATVVRVYYYATGAL